MPTKTALITSRYPKGMQAVSIFEAAYNQAGLDDSRAQRLNERGDELKKGVSKLIAELSENDSYADEEVLSSHGYLSGHAPKQINEQIARLHELFPELSSVNITIAEALLPVLAEGWFTIPRWQLIAPTYGEAVQKVFDLIEQTRADKFHSYYEGRLGPNELHQTSRAMKAFEKLGNAQKDQDILMVPAQFGIRHRGRSVRRVREIYRSNEFGLGAFAVGIMLLTHPERLANLGDLWIDCPGDKFDNSDEDVRFARAPGFYYDGGVRLGMYKVSSIQIGFGSASGFVPQS